MTSDAPQYTSLTELSFLVRRTPDRIRADLHRSRFLADKVGRDWQFTPAQVKTALRYYDTVLAAERKRLDVHGS